MSKDKAGQFKSCDIRRANPTYFQPAYSAMHTLLLVISLFGPKLQVRVWTLCNADTGQVLDPLERSIRYVDPLCGYQRKLVLTGVDCRG